MNPAPTPPPSSGENGPGKLPELNTALLDAAGLEQLLRDIELCAQITEIIPKYAARQQVPPSPALNLADARSLLAARAVRGLQIRYRYQNADWWDTLMVTAQGYRLVRIRHDFSSPNP